MCGQYHKNGAYVLFNIGLEVLTRAIKTECNKIDSYS